MFLGKSPLFQKSCITNCDKMLNFLNFEYWVGGGYQYLKGYPAISVEHFVNIFNVMVNVTFAKIGMQTR